MKLELPSTIRQLEKAQQWSHGSVQVWLISKDSNCIVLWAPAYPTDDIPIYRILSYPQPSSYVPMNVGDYFNDWGDYNIAKLVG